MRKVPRLMTKTIAGKSMIHLRIVTGLLILKGFTSVPSLAKTATPGLEQAVTSQLNGIVEQDIEAYFRKFNLTKPVKVETHTRAQIDESGASPRIVEVNLEVKVITDQPPQIIREARQRLIRLLREQGYRLEPIQGGSPDTRPYATLTIEAVPPEISGDNEESTWVYAGFAGLILALLTSLSVLLYIFFLPLIRWIRRSRMKGVKPVDVPQSKEPVVQDLPPLPSYIAQASSNAASSHPDNMDLPLPPLVSPEPSKIITGAPARSSSIELGGWSTLTQDS